MFKLKTKTLKMKNFLVATVAILSFIIAAPAVASAAAIPAGCPGGPAGPLAPGTTCPSSQTNTVKTTDRKDCNAPTLNKNNCQIINYLFIAINTLSALVGIVIIIMVTVAGIEYSTSGNDPQRVAAARGKITNALLALATFIFMYAFLQWVIPGGLF